MAKLATRRIIPTPEEAKAGAVPMTQSEIIDVLAAYKKQNPAKYEAKKEALFKMYGLNQEEEKVEEKDVADVELEVIKAKVEKKNAK